MSDNIEYNRVIWHSRRGMLELDLVLEPFVKNCYRELSADDQAVYRRLLEAEDQQLFDWFLKKSPLPEGELGEMIAKILAYQMRRAL
jgi:antitoxin CptB